MYLIVGLGNPGKEYEKTRHNLGFRVVEGLGEVTWKKSGKALEASLTINGQKVILLKPQTFMNLSGEAVGERVRFFKIDPSQLLIVHDELDFSLGKIKLAFGGGAGGHNGVSSVITHLGTNDFYRLRLGIGKPTKLFDVSDYVLSPFFKEEEDQVALEVKKAVDGIFSFIEDGATQAMNKINRN